MDEKKLSPFAKAVIGIFEEKELVNHEPKISVNRFISEIASWYEKLRNAMDLQDDEVILKNSIERILKRRLLLGGTADKVAEPLIRELVWARYFPDNTLPQSLISKTVAIISFYQELRHNVLAHHPSLKEAKVNEWILQLMSCQISRLLKPNKEKEAMSNFMYHLLKDSVVIKDDSEDTKNVQVYLAVRRAFAKDDIAFLRFHLFRQLFPEPEETNLEQITKTFAKGYHEIEHQLNYKLKEKIYVYVKRQTPVFFILEDVLRSHKGKIAELLGNGDNFAQAVIDACTAKYKGIKAKVRNAIIRSVFFLLLTKVAIAFAVEGTYDKLMYGNIQWLGLGVNIIVPPILMIIVSLFIKTPGIDNSRRILNKITAVLIEDNPTLAPTLTLMVNPKKTKSLLDMTFAFLWLCAFVLSFGLMKHVLDLVHMNIVSQAVFMFFITIVSFLSYRINLTANAYTVDKGQGLLTPFIDILFLPIIKVGMKLTDGISQINILIFIFDFLIEAPFKVIFGFFEQLFAYLHTKREDLE